jgi:Zn-dependent M16 (insulinase) family peptidase
MFFACRPNFDDTSRLTTLVQMNAGLISTLADNGHRFAISRAASTLTSASQLKEFFTGLEQVWSISLQVPPLVLRFSMSIYSWISIIGKFIKK